MENTANPDNNDQLIYQTGPPGIPLLRIYASGRIERHALTTEKSPPGTDPITKVQSKDIIISPTISARLYLPSNPLEKSPILVYFHGGSFCMGNAFHPSSHTFLNSLVASSNIIALSIDYRLAPEHPIPAAYDDSWQAIKWLCNSSDPWIDTYGDIEKISVAGDSAGANIAHHMVVRASKEGTKIYGMVLIHPYFLGSKAVESEALDFEMAKGLAEICTVACPTAMDGVDDSRINPMVLDGGLAGIGCERALVCVAGKDVLKDRGRKYCEALRESEWKGELVEFEALGLGHSGHLFQPECEEALAQFRVIVDFLGN